jgi:hypothetical protein
MNIYVGGSLRDVPQASELCHEFVERLAETIVERKHTLLTGCLGSMDQTIAEAAFRAIEKDGLDVRKHLIRYKLANDPGGQTVGRVQISRRVDWELTHPDLNPPEQIAEADVCLFIAGTEGTFAAANWARIAEKPVLGVKLFGGAGAQLFDRERERFRDRLPQFVGVQDLDILSEYTDDCAQLARDVVDLCERMLTPRTVFTIMPFSAEYRDVFASYRAVCEEFLLNAERTDETESNQRIIPRILNGIRRSAFVIADVSDVSPNVFYEVGFAEGSARDVVLTAKEGTKLPFDLVDLPVLFWSGQEDLKDKLRRRLTEVTGRPPGRPSRA